MSDYYYANILLAYNIYAENRQSVQSNELSEKTHQWNSTQVKKKNKIVLLWALCK